MGEEKEEKLNVEELILENEKLKKQNRHLAKALGDAHVDIEVHKELIDFLKKKSLEHQLKQQKNSSKKSK